MSRAQALIRSIEKVRQLPDSPKRLQRFMRLHEQMEYAAGDGDKDAVEWLREERRRVEARIHFRERTEQEWLREARMALRLTRELMASPNLRAKAKEALR